MIFCRTLSRVVPAACAAWSRSFIVILRASPWSSSGLPQPQLIHIVLSLSVSRLLQDREKAGFKGAAAPLRGPGGVPQSLFLPRPQGAKKLCNSPAFCINYTCLFVCRKATLLTRY